MASQAALELVVSLRDNASAPLGKTAGAVTDLGKQAEHTHGMLSSMMTGVGFAAISAGITAVSAGFHALGGFIGDSIQESRDAAAGLAQTQAVIKSTGAAAGVTADQIVEMAGALSHATLFTDDAIQADENLLLTFTNLKNGVGAGNDIFTQATKVSLDLAQAMGTDAAGGAVQLGKALNDPTKGISALTRVGVTFTDQQKNQIKTLQDSGNMMGAQKIILAELNKEFGGSAEAAAKADGGFHLFQQRMDDVKQTIGDALQPALASLMGFMAGPGLDAVEALGGGIARWLSGTAVPALTGFLSVLGDLGRYIGAVVSDGDTLNDWLSHLPGWLQPIAEVGGTVIVALRDFAGWITTIGSALAGGDWSGAFDTLTTGLTNFGATIGTAVSTWAGQFVSWIPTAIADVQAALPGIWDAVSTWIIDQTAPLLTQMGVWGSQFVAWVPTAIADVQAALPGIWDAVSLWITDTATTIGTTLVAWGSAFVAWIGPAIPPFLEAIGAFATGIGTAIATGVPVIIERTRLWAGALVDWIQTDAVPRLAPAFDVFLAALAAQADRAKTVLATKGTEAGASFSDGLKAGMTAAPLVVAGVMDTIANQIAAKGPALNLIALAIGKGIVDGMINAMLSDTPSRIVAWGAAAAQAILNIGPNLIAAGLAIGNAAAKALYDGVSGTLNTYRQPLLNLGVSIAVWVADGLNQAANLAGYAAGRIGAAILEGIMAPLAGLAASVAGIVNRALASATAAIRAAQLIHSPSQKWADQIGKPLAQGIGAGFVAGMGTVTPAMVKQLDEAARVMSAAADAVTKGTTAFPLLQTFKPPDASSIAAFTESTRQIVASLGTVAQSFKDKWLEQAQTFFDAASKGMGLISSGVDGLTKLRSFRAPSIANVNAFTDTVIILIQSLGTVAQIFKDDWLTHAQTFFDTAGKGLGIIGAGVDGLTKLRTFRAPSIASINAFTDTVILIVQSLGTAARVFRDDWLAHAGLFADTAGKGLAIIGNGVDGLTKLRDFKAPSVAALNAFTDTVILMVQSLGTVAQTFKDAWLAHASTFADAAAKGLGVIGTAIDGFTKLATYKGLTTGTLEVFATDMETVMTAMIGIANDLGVKGPAAAAVFGDAVGRTIAPIGTAIDTFTKLKDYKGVARDAVLLIGNDMVGVMNTLGIIAGNMSGAGVTAAMAFADSANIIFGALKTALDALSSVADISKEGNAIKGGLGVLSQGITDLVAVIASVDWSSALGSWQTSFTTLFTGILNTVLIPWQTATNDFFSGAGFGFIGQASIGINSAGNGLATSAGNVGGAAGAALVSSMRSNLSGVDAFVSAVNASLGHIEREITIHVKTVYDG